MNDWMNEWFNEWLTEWMVNEWLIEWMNDSMNGSLHKWIREWLNGWMGGWMDDSSLLCFHLLVYLPSYVIINKSNASVQRLSLFSLGSFTCQVVGIN